VPKAAVYKDGFLSSRKDKIGSAGQPSIVKHVSKTSSVRPFPDDHFRFCIPVPYRSHIFAALLLGQDVHDDLSRLHATLAHASSIELSRFA